MATMYYLFFGLLLTAVCHPVGTGDGSVVQKIVIARNGVTWQSDFWVKDQRVKNKDSRAKNKDSRAKNKDVQANNADCPPCAGHARWFFGPVSTLARGAGRVRPLADRGRKYNHASLRHDIIHIASAELGVREATGNNDGKRVEEYLRYTNLSKGHEWCAAFVSWCYGQAGLTKPRNPWSPALFPKARTYWKNGAALSNKQTLKRVQGDGGEGGQVQVTSFLSFRVERSAIEESTNYAWFSWGSKRQLLLSNRQTLKQVQGDGGEGGQVQVTSFLSFRVERSAIEEFTNYGWFSWGSKRQPFLSNRQTLKRVRGDGEKEGGQVHINPADIFGIYGKSAKRINHVGLVKTVDGQYLVTIEGNSNNRVESRRRHLSTIYALADWVGKE